ncbi:7TM chemoreceptor [Ostertagia ostertagi]
MYMHTVATKLIDKRFEDFSSEIAGLRPKMDVLHWIGMMLHITQSIFGLVANGILSFLVLKRTPKQLSTYSVLILNTAICDFVSCAAALFVQQRIIASGFSVFFVSYGPCTFFGTLSCFIGMVESLLTSSHINPKSPCRCAVMMHCYAHGLWSLVYSFSYRYYVLWHRKPKSSTVIFITILMYMPSLSLFTIYSFANDDETELRTTVEAKFGYDMSSECVSGHVNVISWKAFPAFLYSMLPIAPAYVAILVLRRLTILKLVNEKTISENSRRLQSQLLQVGSYTHEGIIKIRIGLPVNCTCYLLVSRFSTRHQFEIFFQALTVQACLPVFFLIAIIMFTTGLLNIYHHPIPEHLSFVIMGFTPMLTPLTSLYFIRPYRVWMLRTFLPSNEAVTSSLPT